jgi:hypothetical protein
MRGSASALQMELQRGLSAVLGMFSLLPRHKQLRATTVLFLHRMVPSV